MQEARLYNNIPLKRHLVSKGCSYPLTFQFSVVGKIQDYAELERLFLRLNELIQIRGHYVRATFTTL
ncbi:hypothetical protein EEO81_19345 [Salmonella enterica]|uniref:Uncharacterized protein n=5 Tax=Salmonella enterica I TaxID=59201 RepID=A0A5W3W6L3_SALET|nr:hypothetical protein [Salmonella enterica subsp. enterica serovar Saintpaul]EAA5669833.1 hypothetical protein [Salmonella enterica subsp. enterica serovar Haifa]EAB0244655.1 hypothetical protein [Salmonella enterica]ECF7062738.1 hypothetical protein [Salmonella enterica subsp. enterica]EAB0132715.1 hypothetical protein [Salmonella enterica subsp. enterica serovar Saintpaul]